jgi:preprotein translocase subunit SecA
MVTRSIESAQRKVEARNFDIRKQLLEYDDVSNDQRKVIYQQRNDILDASNLTAQIASLREGCFEDLVRQFVPVESVEEQWDIAGLQHVLRNDWHIELPLMQHIENAQAITDEDILHMVVQAAHEAFHSKINLVGVEQFTPFMRAVLLQNIDSHWREHLSSLDYLRQGIHLRGYAQKQPKQEYKREAFELFGQLLDMVKNEVTRILMTVQIETASQVEDAAQAIEQRADAVTNLTYSAPDETGQPQLFGVTASDAASEQVAVVGRNEPCPCGSGKKYKHCHGKLV